MLTTLLTILLIISSPITGFLFLVKWIETDADTAYATFENFVNSILGEE